MPKRKAKGGFKPASNYIPKDSAGRGERPARAGGGAGPGGNPRWASENRRDGAAGDDRRGGSAGRDDRRGSGAAGSGERGAFRGDDRRSGGTRAGGDDRRGGYAGRGDDRRGGSAGGDDRRGGYAGRGDDRRGGYGSNTRPGDDRRSAGRGSDHRRGGYSDRSDDRRGGYDASGRNDSFDRGGDRDRGGSRGSDQSRPRGDDRYSTRRGAPARGAASARGGARGRDGQFSDRNERIDRHHHDALRQSHGRQPAAGSRGDRSAKHFDPTARGANQPQRGAIQDYRSHSQSAAGRAPSHDEDRVLERLAPTAVGAKNADGLSFGDLGLGANIVDALAELGAPSPFPIQASTIPDAIQGRDVLGRGRTGSGKTIAFGAALVQRLSVARGRDADASKRKIGRAPRALIVAPTRELALQIDRTIQPIARSVGLFTTQVYGGVPQQRQVTALGRGVDIVIGTPGRIEDLERQGFLRLDQVEITVLDEADQMCDLGFLEPVQRILRMTMPGGQRLLFSATLDAAVQRLVTEFLKKPSVHEVAGEEEQHTDIDHSVLVVERDDKRAVIEQLAGSGGRVLIFTKTRIAAEGLATELSMAGVPAAALHGDLTQGRRTHNLRLLTSGKVNVLVATDVAARGIHVDDIRLVIQSDMPEEYKSYLHRSGRTGRAGQRGTVVTVIPKQRRRRMSELLERAEIDAPMIPARPGGAELDAFMAYAD
ncbi:superfamily II DNA/RNA helicase [Pseudoclavibacter sp. JAI123]|uniref:DEAD/DEAH box helicase n=1 Tax=Pseudoclavibacter sp. JAI123 TaxID=2723065 RepID=UPI0015CC5F7F|nr:DEAD/DEAH box helicase [Pseudoclavibacter sp. JAI123]NYF12569.1 superfamily II DNA/RNA helicase [Pseudoclavibacter sp. JAI123]